MTTCACDYEPMIPYQTAWLRQAGHLSDPAAAIDRLHPLALDHGKYCLVNIQHLYDLIGQARTAAYGAGILLQAANRLVPTDHQEAP